MTQTISRRTVLRGLGTAIALPWLEAMAPARGAEDPQGRETPFRMLFMAVPNGMHMPDWTPDETGDEFHLKSILEPVGAFQQDMLVLSGLTLDGARPHGDGGGDHARSCAAFLTGAHPRKTHGADIHNGVSVDQMAAKHVGKRTRFASLELGIERGAQSGNCDSGYSCAYSCNISWRTPTTPVAKEVDPSAVFDRLFGGGGAADQQRALAQRRQHRKSILDFALEDARALKQHLGRSDQRKLDEYMFAVRDVERRLTEQDPAAAEAAPVDDVARPEGIPREFENHVHLMLDLVWLAFRTDSTRIITFMFANEGSNRNYPQIGVSEGHHTLSHHGNDDVKQSKISKINRFHVSLLAHLLKRLAESEESGRRLLDESLVVYGSGIGDGNRHNHDQLPIVTFGKAGGAVRPGRHLSFPRETPLTNLYLQMLHLAGVSTEQFGDSTGALDAILA